MRGEKIFLVLLLFVCGFSELGVLLIGNLSGNLCLVLGFVLIKYYFFYIFL